MCTDSQVAVAALGASGTESLLVANNTVGGKPGNYNTGTWAQQHSVERDYRQASKGGSLDQIYQSGALLTTILEQI